MKQRRFPLQSLREVTLIRDQTWEDIQYWQQISLAFPPAVNHIRMNMMTFFEWYRCLNNIERYAVITLRVDLPLERIDCGWEVPFFTSIEVNCRTFDILGGYSLKDSALFLVAQRLCKFVFVPSLEIEGDYRLPQSMPSFRFVKEATLSFGLSHVRIYPGFVVSLKGEHLLELFLLFKGHDPTDGFFFQKLLSFLEFNWDNPFASRFYPNNILLSELGELQKFTGKLEFNHPLIGRMYSDLEIDEFCDIYTPNVTEIVGFQNSTRIGRQR